MASLRGSSAQVLRRGSLWGSSLGQTAAVAAPCAASRATLSTLVNSSSSDSLRSSRKPALSIQLCAAASARGLRQARVLKSSATIFSKDRSWVDKGEVTYDELKPETEAPSGHITLIDVREPDEVAQGMIPSSVNVPLSEFKSAFDVNKSSRGAFSSKYAFDRPGFDDKIVFYCRSGKRSTEAQDFARKMGWWNARNYKGSWLDWVVHAKNE
ncbi:Rhodanese-like protein [Tilletiaria anomala UBC 951]|uniref:Rhodanese-like protein n=1 Tax=Tilletiaria anomala (strain ATCC 24038 / CBS 436.72 / UBC 951) TaxID=1037660 RepID=A0A066VZG6_TILAU|nr:Rhodanese-like protein [Tilletiaria anomala UBC 951]KDN43910.1 Rhodanese-like protein [Tilletiaria anomala UBC 951]